MSTMQNSPYYRTYELPWEGDNESRRRFRRIFTRLLAVFVFFGILFPLLPSPEPNTLENSVPERLARVMIESKPKPPPPPPPKPQEKPKVEPKPRLAVVTPPPPTHEQAHEKAQRQLNKIKDELADLRQQMDLSAMRSSNLTGSVMEDPHAERNLLTSRLSAGSGGIGITAAAGSRNFGRGAGSLGGHDTMAVPSNVGHSNLDSRGPTRTGSSGKAARSREEIEVVFDKNKGAIYALYNRATRENPQLQGKLVLEFTISPSGEVTMCRVVSTELNDKALEEKIIALVRLFHFEARDVAPITTTKPIDFFPA
jgi:TonB family protein